MPFSLRPAPAPDHPHLVCRDGYYWHPKRTGCVTGHTTLTTAEVLACFEGSALRRAEALARLTVGQRLALFPLVCQGCAGGNHAKAAENLERAWRSIQPGARAAAAELGARDVIALAAVRRATDDETAEAQVLAAAAVRLGGSGRRRSHRRADQA